MQCGKCRISGADLEGFRSQSGHPPVTQSLSSEKLSPARHPADQRRGRNRPRSRPAFSTREFSTWVRRMRVSRICGRFWLAPRSLGRGDRNRRESRLIRPPRDTSDRACDRVRPVFSKKQENTGDNGLKRARETCSLAVGCRWTSSGSGGMNARPAYLRHER